MLQKSQTPPAPEQTCSLLSLLFWSVLDPIIFSSYKHGRVAHDELPPLVDSDAAKHLADTALPLLDPISGPKRHLFWGLMSIFREFYAKAFCIHLLNVLKAMTLWLSLP